MNTPNQLKWWDNLKAIGFIIAIAILFPMVINFGTTLLYPQPKYPSTQQYQIQTKITLHKYKSEAELVQLKANLQKAKEKMKQYNLANQKYNAAIFYANLIAGILALIIGFFVSVLVIGNGLILGGILSLIYGYTSYWSNLNNVMQFTSLLIALIIVIVFAYKVFHKQHSN